MGAIINYSCVRKKDCVDDDEQYWKKYNWMYAI